MLGKKQLREIVQEQHSEISLPEMEKLVEQVLESIDRYGVLRTATIGEVAEVILLSELDKEQDEQT